MMIATGKLNDTGLLNLRNKLINLNKRAVRLGLDELIVRVVRVEEIEVRNPSGLLSTHCINHIEVDGCVPRINGWVVVARIEFTEAGNLVHCAPGVGSVYSYWRTAPNKCEHCNTKRRRNDVIVIRHSDGSEIVVGRNCLADYIRTENAEGLIEYASWLGKVDRMINECESDYYSGNGQITERIETIVRAASICIRKLGWVSGREAYIDGKPSTKNDVCALLTPPADSNGHKIWERWIKDCELTVCAYDIALAGNAIEWAKSLDPGDSEYLHNLTVLAQLDRVGTDKFGYLVSLIPAYNKAMERETERAARADAAAYKGSKVYLGEPKKRERNVKATCTGINSFEGNYGVTTIVRFEHSLCSTEYAVLTWFASGDKTEDFEVGTEYTFDATCKEHKDSDKYGKQTLINRVTVK